MPNPTDVIRNAISELIAEVDRIQDEHLNVNAEELSAFVEQLKSVEQTLAAIAVPTAVKKSIRLNSLYSLRRTNLRGQTRSDTFFILPLLRALEEAGGEARRNVIKERVYELVRDELSEADLAMLPGSKEVPRWTNRVDWARNKLKALGYMSSDSKPGIWAITAAGRTFLQQQTPEKHRGD